MKPLPLALLLSFSALFLASCSGGGERVQQLEAREDSLQVQLKKAYTPGFGELMLNIQIHHAKLWFAGENSNWPLAVYEQSLIRSGFKKIKNYHADNPATKAADMIQVPMDSIDAAISRKDLPSFKRSFQFLTATCNNCHQVTNHAFNVITVPAVEPLGNQSFKVQ